MARLHTVSFACVNGLPEDITTMSFCTIPQTVETPTADAFARTAIAEFFTTAVAPHSNPLGAFLGASRSRSENAIIKTYDLTGHLDGSPHGSPVGQSTFTVPAIMPGGMSLPDEVAVCVRLETATRATEPVEQPDGADPGGAVDRPKQRHTGRFYFGPLVSGSVVIDMSTGIPRPLAAFLTQLRDSVNAKLHDQMVIDAAYDLAIWSRTDATARAAEFVVTDDAFDTQRRRGPDRTGFTRLALAG